MAKRDKSNFISISAINSFKSTSILLPTFDNILHLCNMCAYTFFRIEV